MERFIAQLYSCSRLLVPIQPLKFYIQESLINKNLTMHFAELLDSDYTAYVVLNLSHIRKDVNNPFNAFYSIGKLNEGARNFYDFLFGNFIPDDIKNKIRILSGQDSDPPLLHKDDEYERVLELFEIILDYTITFWWQTSEISGDNIPTYPDCKL